MMGLFGSVWWFAWYLTYFVITLVPSVLVTILSFYTGVFTYSNPFFIWLAVFLYAQNLVAFSFIMSTLFDKARTASQLGALASLVLFFPKYLLTPNTPVGARLFSYFSGMIAFSDSFAAISQAEIGMSIFVRFLRFLVVVAVVVVVVGHCSNVRALV